MRRGFTLVELVLTMALVGIVVSLLLPSLSGVRHNVLNAGEISKLRQHAMVFAAYRNDHEGWYPFFFDPEATRHVVRCGSFAAIAEYFFDQRVWWNFALGDAYYDGVCRGSMFWDPRDPRIWWSAYEYSAAFMARPEFWNETTRTGPGQWRRVNDADVLYPSRKALLVHHAFWWRTEANVNLFPHPYVPGRQIMFALIDGTAGMYRREQLGRWYARGEGDWSGSTPGMAIPGVHTYDGARGMDVIR